MTRFKLLSAIVIMPMVFATPVLAQQAVQEPGALAFYQSIRGYGYTQFEPRDAVAFYRGPIHVSRTGRIHRRR